MIDKFLKNLPENIKKIKPVHCITVMTMFSCFLVSQLQKSNPISEIGPIDYEDNILIDQS